MKTKTYIVAWTFAVLCLFALAIPVVCAADPGAVNAIATIEEEPVAEQPAPAHLGIIEMLSPVVAFVVTFLIKKSEKIPGFVLVAIPGIAAGLFTYLGSLLGAVDIPVWQGVLLGLLANVVHQFGVQVNQSIDRSSPTVTGNF